MQKVVVIGGGIGGLSTAIYLARAGYEVSLYEKNDHVGGRASLLEEDGYRFDMWPSRYLMPDVFERFYEQVEEDITQHLQLTKLDPSYRIFFTPQNRIVDIAADLERDLETFEKIEKGVSKPFKEYLCRASYQYTIAMKKFVYRNYDSVLDFFSWDTFIDGIRLNVFQKMASYVKRFFKSAEMQKIVSYPLLFLGTSPYDALAIYALMSHVDFAQGVWYPKGGLYEIIRSLQSIAEKNGVKIYVNSPVTRIVTEDGRTTGIELADGKTAEADIVVSNADMHFTETVLLEKHEQTYPESYRKKKVLAPSAYILYLGVAGKLPMLTHHNLIFTEDWKKNFAEIFKTKEMPTDPSLYICKPSESDDTVAPAGHENMFVLVPCPPGVELSQWQEDAYTEKILAMISQVCHIPDLQDRIRYQKLFHIKHFQERYNAYKGTALGLAHTFMQTSAFRPNNYSKKVKGLYYTWAYTNPWIGTQMALISWELTAQRVLAGKNH